LLSGYLLSSQGDRVGMAHSVEGRFAFLDHVLIEFAARIPHFRNMPGLDEKDLLKRIGRGLIPDSILRRKKFPYRAPDIESFLKIPTGRDLLIQETEPARLRDFGLFDPGKVKQLLDKVMSARDGDVATSENLVLMAVLSGQIFHRIFSRYSAAQNKFGPDDKVLRADTLEDRCLRSM
jgi:asparagine synthase (glutamine-hydrolysing)